MHAFRFRTLQAAVAGVLSVLAAASQAQSITLNNASFEGPDFGTSWFNPDGGASIVSPGAQDLTRYALLEAGELIYQSFSVTTTGAYFVNFWATGEGRSRLFDSNDVSAQNYASPVATSGDPGTLWGAGWHAVSYSFNAVAGESLHLYFSGQGSGLGLDGVTIAAAVPEPESYAMMLAGLGALGFTARRRRRSQL
jgi:hypothetical protein